MSNDSTVVAVSGRTGHLRAGAGGTRTLRVVTAERGAAAGTSAVSIALGPFEWALAVPPGPWLPRPAAASLPGPALRPVPHQFALVRDCGTIDPCLGLAVLHHQRGRTRIYCGHNQIEARTAQALSVLAGRAINGDAGQAPLIAVAPVEHSLLADLHPAAEVRRGQDITIAVCSDTITEELARVLGVLLTAHSGHLLRPGRESDPAQVSRADPAQVLPGSPGSPAAMTS